MLALSFLPFLLFTASLAAPSRRQIDCVPPQALYLPQYQTAITPPAEKLQFVTLGVGNQNYTCSPQGTYTSTGAVVEVFDISPTFPSSVFYDVQNLAFADWLSYDGDNPYDPNFIQQIADSYGIEPIGQHYFQNGANGLTPIWDFRQVYGSNAIALAKEAGDLPSPEPGSVDWLHLTVSSGGLAQDILRLYTNGGEPPSQCLPGSGDISVKFTTDYWLYGGTTGKC